MSVRSALSAVALSAGIMLGLVLLILIISFGAIFAIIFRNRRGGFHYFAGGDGINCSHAAATGKQE